MIARWVQDLILAKIDPWVVQEPTLTPQDILQAIIVENLEGNNTFLGSKAYKTVLMLRRETEWVADVHLISDAKSPWQMIKAIKKAQEYAFSNTDFHRLQMKTHLKNVCKLAERCGWEYEGEHKEAVKLEDGTYVSEYSYGLVNKDE
jgi:hypothetical protein